VFLDRHISLIPKRNDDSMSVVIGARFSTSPALQDLRITLD